MSKAPKSPEFLRELRRAMDELSITSSRIGTLCGINRSYMKKITDGVSRPSGEMLGRILAVLGEHGDRVLQAYYRDLQNEIGSAASPAFSAGIHVPKRVRGLIELAFDIGPDEAVKVFEFVRSSELLGLDISEAVDLSVGYLRHLQSVLRQRKLETRAAEDDDEAQSRPKKRKKKKNNDDSHQHAGAR